MGSPAAAESFGLVVLGARERAAPAVAAAAVPGLAALPEDSRPSSGFPRPGACSGSAGRAGAAEAGGRLEGAPVLNKPRLPRWMSARPRCPERGLPVSGFVPSAV